MLSIYAVVNGKDRKLGIIYDDVNNSAVTFRDKEEFIMCLIEIGINVNEILDYFLKEEIEGEFKSLGLDVVGIL
jgi:hypothetical protein